MKRLLSFILAWAMSISAGEYEPMTSAKEALHALLHKKEILSERYAGQVSEEVWDESPFSWDDTVLLTKQPDRDFVILNLSDIHFADYDYRTVLAFASMRTAHRLVETVRPDLITISGDLVCSKSTVYSIRRLTDFMESLGVPWAPVFGNHDDEGNCDLNFLADTMLKSPHCLLRKGDPDMGVGNYILRIAEKDGETLRTVQTLFMLDSHHDTVNERQQAWYNRAADGIRTLTDGEAAIAALMHIPLPEYQYAYDEAVRNGTLQGELHETICCARADGVPVQNGFFDILRQTHTTHVLCGHDHMNNFSVVYKGIRLTYMMKLGKGSGFQVGFDGGTVIRVGHGGIREIEHLTRSFGGFKTLLKTEENKS